MFNQTISQMKTLFVFLMLLISVKSFCQETTTQKRSPEKIAATELKMVQREITTLTQSQKDQLQVTYNTFAANLSQVQSESSKKRKLQTFQRVDAIKDEEVKKILTEEQWKQYETISEEMNRKMMERRRRN